MPPKKPPQPPPVEPRAFTAVEEIDRAIKKLQRRIEELSGLNVQKAVLEGSGEADAIRSNIREAIREIFGENSPEFREHQHVEIWAGPMGINMSPERIIDAQEKGKVAVRTTLENLIARLREKREELDDGSAPAPESYFAKLNLHHRIADVANDLYLDRHHWDAVFAAAKALVNYVKERSGTDLDGANLMRTVFSRQKPILAFNDLADQTKQDEQEGMMHLFEGAVLAIRNPGGHAFPEGSAQRALEYISFLSLLAYRVGEAKAGAGAELTPIVLAGGAPPYGHPPTREAGLRCWSAGGTQR